ncbi:hypothetical protein, partial [Marinovum sp. 1_MG-2023]|uniref:hypothetical protein n=1 Tax=Marinovum sp. 1_MG-2023 TaxID=3062633 RepID=UPI0030143C22
MRTADGLDPLSNIVTRKPVAKQAEITRVDQKRYFEDKAAVRPGITTFVSGDGDTARLLAFGREATDGDEKPGAALTIGATNYVVDT